MSEKNMDDLLAQLKEEFEPTREPNRHTQKSPVQKPPQPTQSTSSPTSIEKMLDELRADIESGRGRPQKSQQTPQNKAKSPPVTETKSTSKVNKDNAKYRERLNILIDQDYQMQARKREAKLAEIKRQKEAQLAEQKRRQQQLIEAQKREELRERRRKEALKEKAQQWLKNLNMRSEEGKWFEEFSYSYEDKLQAAIDYLEAMRESGL